MRELVEVCAVTTMASAARHARTASARRQRMLALNAASCRKAASLASYVAARGMSQGRLGPPWHGGGPLTWWLGCHPA